MRIGAREIGRGRPTFITAEAGSNHAGSLDAALALVDAASRVGADAVKFQLWDADKMYEVKMPEHASAVRWQMPREWAPQLKARAEERGIEFMCSAFDLGSLDFIDEFVPAHKVASIEAMWPEFVQAVAGKRKPMIVSTGACDLVNALHSEISWHEVVLMECCVAYPAALGEANVRAMPLLGQTGRLFGYSDHTLDPFAVPCAAVALGASVIEKHLRLDDTPHDSPDFGHSIDPGYFAAMVKAIRKTEKAMGKTEKVVRESERAALRYRRGAKGLRGP